MNTIEKVEHWADAHHPVVIDIFRIGLGILLFAKGLIYAQSQTHLLAMLGNETMTAFGAALIAHYVIMAHLFGGLMIAIGLLTRWAVAFQLPILLGAIIFFNLPQGFYYAELWQAVIAFAVCVMILIYGSGKFSVDAFMKSHPKV